MSGDGFTELKVATSVGILRLPRQVLFDQARGEHVVPANRLLPAHQGMLITRRLQEWACLLGRDFAFPTAQRLLGWQAGEEKLLCPKEVQRLVCRHGQLLREAAEQEVRALLARPDGEELSAQLVPALPPRRPAAWPAVLEAAVAAALAAENPPPPAGVSPADWERVLAVRRAEPAARAGASANATAEAATVTALSRLGPELAADQILVSADEVLVRQPAQRTFAELRTARVATATGYRYLCGTGGLFLQQLWLLLRLCGAQRGLVTFLSDGGRWLREFAQEQLSRLPQCETILDWYHLVKKVKDRISRMGGSKAEKQALRKAVVGALWAGDVAAALQGLDDYRGTATNQKALVELQEYLRARRAALPNYRERRAQRQYIGSGQAEKANDLLVARRQKNRGMHWNIVTSEALAWLKALQLNHDWETSWAEGRLPSLVAA
jgi:hypothetical protein